MSHIRTSNPTNNPDVARYLASPEFKAFQQENAGGIGTMDMYESPYFGSFGSGSFGGAQDAHYLDWLKNNPGTTDIVNDSGGILNVQVGNPVGGTGSNTGGIADINVGGTNTGGTNMGGTTGVNVGGTGGATTGGATTGGTTTTTTLDPSQSTLSPNFAQYVYNMMRRGEQAAMQPYTFYTGQRFAGVSPLEQQAFSGLSSLQTPWQYGMASDIYGQAAQRAGQMGYQPGQFTSQFEGPALYQPTQFTSGFQFQPTTPTQFANQFKGPGAYQPATDLTSGMSPQQYQSGQFQTGLGQVGSVQDYMNQYQQGVTDIAAREARRQSQIGGLGERAAAARSGAFGGSRQAILEAERQRNLEQQLGDIQQKGLASAFDAAQRQRLAESQAGMEAQRLGEQSRQFGAGLTQQGLGQLLQARQAQEASRQFAAQQGMQAADLQARYGLSAEQAQEAARQFSEGQRLTAAQLQQQFGMDAQKAQEMANQFASQQAMQAAQFRAQYGTEAQRMAEQSRQYGADFGLRALQQQLAAAQGLGSIGGQQFGAQMEGLRGMLGAGGIQRQIAQQPLDFGYQQFQESLQYPYKQATFMKSLLEGMPVGAAPYRPATDSDSIFGSALQGGLSGLALYNMFNKN